MMPLATVRKLFNDSLLPHAACRLKDCEHCSKGKYRRRFKGSLIRTIKGGSINCVTNGEIKCISNDGHIYFAMIVEEFSRLAYACQIWSKSEASMAVLRYVKRIQKQSGYTVTSIHSNNRTECSRAFTVLTDDEDICTRRTMDTPVYNVIAEMIDQTIMNDVRSCLEQSNLPERFWHYALRHILAAQNTAPHPTTD